MSDWRFLVWLMPLISTLALAADPQPSDRQPQADAQEHPRVVYIMSWQRSALPPALEFPATRRPPPAALDSEELRQFLGYRKQIVEAGVR